MQTTDWVQIADWEFIFIFSSDLMKAWNSFKKNCGSFVKTQIKWPLCQKQKISRNGKGIFHNSANDRERWGLLIFCPPSPPSAPQTYTHQQKGHCLPNDLCPSYLQPYTTLFPILITTNAQVFLSHNCPKVRENSFHKSWKFTYTNSTVPIFNKSKKSIQT